MLTADAVVTFRTGPVAAGTREPNLANTTTYKRSINESQ